MLDETSLLDPNKEPPPEFKKKRHSRKDRACSFTEARMLMALQAAPPNAVSVRILAAMQVADMLVAELGSLARSQAEFKDILRGRQRWWESLRYTGAFVSREWNKISTIPLNAPQRKDIAARAAQIAVRRAEHAYRNHIRKGIAATERYGGEKLRRRLTLRKQSYSLGAAPAPFNGIDFRLGYCARTMEVFWVTDASPIPDSSLVAVAGTISRRGSPKQLIWNPATRTGRLSTGDTVQTVASLSLKQKQVLLNKRVLTTHPGLLKLALIELDIRLPKERKEND